MTARRFIRFVLLILPVVVCHVSAAPYYWRAFEVFPQKYQDGERWMREWTHSLTHLKVTEEVERARFQLLQGALEMELETLFTRLPIVTAPRERAIAVIARREKEGTLLGLHPEWKTPQWKSIGDFNIMGRLQKSHPSESDHYFLDASLSAHHGPYPSALWKKFFDRWVLDFFSDQFGQGLPLEWQKSMPRLSAEITQFVDVTSKVQDLKDGRIIEIDGRVKMKVLEKKHRQAYRYLRRLQGAFQLQLTIKNPPYGDHLIIYDSKERRLFLRLAMGRSQAENGDWPKQLSALAQVTVQLHGVNVNIEDWPLEIVHNAKDFSFEWRSAGVPKKMDMKANTLMALPLLVAKNFLHLDRDLHEFFEVLSSDKERQGLSNIGIHWEEDGGQAQVRASLVVPFRHSTLIRMGMGMLGHRLNPPPALLQELENWRAYIFDLLLADFEQVALQTARL